ncbi:hypothetical protein M0R45_009008 [Rubus argutus]|uniref:Uncharacterized protein n=1 Tax=Rubus argutus TaxID=59490 RepID=A0AAW1Y3Q4_RUBAR
MLGSTTTWLNGRDRGRKRGAGSRLIRAGLGVGFGLMGAWVFRHGCVMAWIGDGLNRLRCLWARVLGL